MKLGRIILFFVLLPLILVLTVRHCMRETGEIPIRSVPVERIGEGMKFTVTPIKISSDHELIFSVRLETYQYPELLEHNLEDTALLVDDFGNPIIPSKWTQTKKDQYSIMGELAFPVLPNARHFKLTFEELDDVEFEWKLPKKL